jgi:phospholipid/cholesterol/gamma-HCH transport system permease protein
MDRARSAPMATAEGRLAGSLERLIDRAYDALAAFGDLAVFAWQAFSWGFVRRPSSRNLLPVLYAVGVKSVPVVAVTGLFIGMVIAIQSYDQFSQLGMATHLGGIINLSVVRELGPVLAACMLAGRIGSAMAAELGTMRITEQIDALECLGTNPIAYLVVPRLLACVLLIPLLTILADFMGVMGGVLICTQLFHVDAYHYWEHAKGIIGYWDMSTGLIKPMFFGAAIAVISCHRGFNSRAGAEGVGRAATEAFVSSFIAIFVLDFFLAMFLNTMYGFLWPGAGPKIL